MLETKEFLQRRQAGFLNALRRPFFADRFIDAVIDNGSPHAWAKGRRASSFDPNFDVLVLMPILRPKVLDERATSVLKGRGNQPMKQEIGRLKQPKKLLDIKPVMYYFERKFCQ